MRHRSILAVVAAVVIGAAALAPAQASSSSATASTAATSSTTAGANSTFVPLPYSQLLSTRTTGETKLSPTAAKSIQVLGVGGVPSSGVAAVALDVTTIDSSAASWVSLRPSGGSGSGITNHFTTPGQQAQNNVYVAPGADGKITVHTGAGATDLVVAVTGYFADDGNNSGFYPSTDGIRYADTRENGIPLGAGESITVDTAIDPSLKRANAVALSITTLNATARSYLTVGTDSTRIGLDYDTVTASSSVIASVEVGGSFTVKNHGGSPVNVIVDLQGYFVPHPDAGGFAVSTGHILDTRSTGAIPANGTLVVPMAGKAGIPQRDVSAYALDITVLPGGSAGYLRVYPDGLPEFGYGTVNFEASGNRSNSALIAAGEAEQPGAIVLRNRSSSPVHVLVDAMGYFGKTLTSLPVADTSLLGQTLDEQGRPVEGEGVGLYAWPSEQELASMAIGTEFALKEIATATTDEEGYFDLEPTVDPSTGSPALSGKYDVSVIPDSASHMAQSSTPTDSSVALTLHYSSALDAYDFIPGGMGAGTVTDEQGGESSPGAVPVGTSAIAATSLDDAPFVSLAVPSDVSGANAPAPTSGTVSASASSGCPAYGKTAKLIETRYGVPATVTSTHSETDGYSAQFTMSRGADISIGVASNWGKVWKAAGTSSRTLSTENGWGARTTKGNINLKTFMTYGTYQMAANDEGGSFCTKWKESKAIDHEGGAKFYSGSQPPATKCREYSKGGYVLFENVKAVTYSGGVDTSGFLGISLTTNVGWSKSEKMKVTSTVGTRNFCGTDQLPGKNPQRLVVKKAS